MRLEIEMKRDKNDDDIRERLEGWTVVLMDQCPVKERDICDG